MSEDKYPSEFPEEDFEEPAKTIETHDELIPNQQDSQMYGVQEYYTQPPDQMAQPPVEEKKRKKGRTVVIIIFAIILPVLLALTGLGLLIWGFVVGFTNCFTACGDACNSCFNCCEGCNACSNSCDNCSNSCSNCGNSCDNCTSCCGSSSSIEHRVNTVSAQSLLKESISNFTVMMEWYIYTIIELIKGLF